MRKEHLGFSLVAVAVFVLGGLAAAAGELPVGTSGVALGLENRDASSVGSDLSRPDTYGTGGWVKINYSAAEFTPDKSGEWIYDKNSGFSYCSNVGNPTCTGIHIPSGASWQGITRYTDDSDVGHVGIEIRRVNLLTNTSVVIYSWNSTGTPGIERVYDAFTTPETVDNDQKAYTVCIFPNGVGTSIRHAGITVWYKLQVSPAPVTATFSDVPTGHWAFQFVEALAASGITSGCAAGQFCPDNPITRAEMAVFLSAALGLHWPN